MFVIFLTGIPPLQLPSSFGDLRINELIDFIEQRFKVHVKMLLHQDKIVFNEQGRASSEPIIEELYIRVRADNIAQMDVKLAIPKTPIQHLIGRGIDSERKIFYDINCLSVNTRGEDVDLPKFRVFV